jgi:Domain of unknown function (DUF4386)
MLVSSTVNSTITELPQKQIARIAGAFYLAFILSAIIADATAHIGSGDAAKIIQALTSNPDLFKVGFVISLLSGFFFFVAAWFLYILLKSIDKNLALLFLLLNLIGVAIQCIGMLPLYAAILSVGNINSETYLFVNTFKSSIIMAQLFFGTWLFPLGYLVYKSVFIPKIIGTLLLLDGFAELIWLFQSYLLPRYPQIHYPGFVIGFAAEFGLTLWLLVKGVRAEV